MKRNTYTIRFECKSARANKDGNAPIYCIITICGKAALIQLPKKCKPEEFRKLMNAQRDNRVKSYCEAVKAELDTIHTRLSMTDDTVTAARIKDIYLNGAVKDSYTFVDLKHDMMLKKSTDKVSVSTWGKYELAFNDFLSETGHTLSDEVSSVTHADILLFEARLMGKQKEMTVKKKLKNMKAFFAHAVAANKIPSNPFQDMTIGSGEADEETEYLTYAEIQKIKALDLRCDRLCRARDMFLWQCFTGQNIGDMAMMSPDDVKYNEDYDQYYIQKSRKKVGKFGKKYIYLSVLFEDAIDIWRYYKGVLPYIQGQHYNQNIDDMVKMAGIDKHITSKSGRATYACYLLNTKGIRDWTVLGKMLGHSNERQTREYCKIFDETVFKVVAKDKDDDRVKKLAHPELMRLEDFLKQSNDGLIISKGGQR